MTTLYARPRTARPIRAPESPLLARAITWKASKQTYLTVRFLVDRDRVAEAAAYFEEAGFSFPLAFDPPGNVLVELGARGLPVSLLVDAEGRIHKRWVGPLTREMLDEDVTLLLAAQGREG